MNNWPLHSTTFVLSFALALLISLSGCDSSDADGEEPLAAGALNCADIASFTSESKTYQVAGTTTTFTSITEGFPEKVNDHDVLRVRILNEHPDGLGEYIGCDPEKGFLDVATDSWNALEPQNSQYYDRKFWDPPLFTCSFGVREGTVCEWSGLYDGEPEREVSRVLGYESIQVPFGSLTNVMKMENSSFDESGIYSGPAHFWVDESLGIVRVTDLTSGASIELLSYDPPSANKSYAPTATFGLEARIIHRLMSSQLHSNTGNIH